MTVDANQFLAAAAITLIASEGARMVKAPPGPDSLAPWTPPEWDEWDQVLVADGPGTRPAIFTFRTSPIAEGDIRTAYEQLVDVAANLSVRGANVPVRTIAVFCVSGIQPEAARKLCRLSPRRYFPNVQPELWVVDLTAGRLYTPRAFGFFTSRAGKAVRGALQRLEQGHGIELNDIAEAQRTARVDREAFARAVSKNVPYLTYAIIAICALVFLYEGHLAPKCWLDASSPACQKASIWLQFGAMQPRAVEHGQWWRLFTEMFMHFGALHIFFNMVALYSLGTLVERVYGSVRYGVIYLVSGILASFASFYALAYGIPGLVAQQPTNVAGGASGAIFGIAGVVMALGLKRDSLVPRAIALQLSVLVAALIGFNLISDFFSAGIDYRAHIGGLVVGLILGYVLMPSRPSATQTPEPVIP